MIDWFVLLIPLAVVPIVLVFGFVGCTLDSSGVPRAQLSYPAGLKQLLVEMEVTVEVTGANGESQSDTKTLQGENLLPEEISSISLSSWTRSTPKRKARPSANAISLSWGILTLVWVSPPTMTPPPALLCSRSPAPV